ncbi:two-component sensor histidine kinase [Spirosoma sp. HMF4905]|uniref:histidine kinase n=2 Tax=Spirosoma arboris TaxID=2682092 RepID=A0A7K1S652_9BACT|nr:two-component sensor histidine kinase [Spirosoma arboris]
MFLPFLALSTVAQPVSYSIDSLRNELARAKADTSRVWLMTKLSEHYYERNFDSARWYAQQGIHLAQRVGHRKGELQSSILLGDAYSVQDIPQSMRIYLQALQLAQQMNYQYGVGMCNLKIGELNLFLENYPQAIRYLKQAHDIFLTVQDKQQTALADSEIGIVYCQLAKKQDSARYYLTRSDQEYPPFKHDPFQLYYWAVLESNENPSRAVQLFGQSIELFKRRNERRGLGYAYRWYAIFLKNHHQLDSSILMAKNGLRISQHLLNFRSILQNSDLLTKVYQALGRPDSAYKYQSIMMAARDSLFSQQKINQIQNTLIDEQQRVQRLQEEKSQFKSQVKIYGLLGIMTGLLLLAGVLYRTNRQKQKTNSRLQVLNHEIEQQKEEIETQRDYLEETLTELKSTQAQLIQKEKLASLGELTAGIAHEIQNPLNFVNNFSEVSTELVEEQKEALAKGDTEEAKVIADDLSQNLQKIHHHGGRASAIVKGMLEHSRTDSGEKRPTSLNALADEYLKIAYQGLRAKDKSFECTLVTEYDADLGQVNVVPQEIGRVLLNLYNNAFYAVRERQQHADSSYLPTVRVTTEKTPEGVQIRVADNGTGIPESMKQKIFQPFFTTKPTGEGTGLGLSLSYDIITKGHGGTLRVESQAGDGTAFFIELPQRQKSDSHV